MYIPDDNQMNDQTEIGSFMKRFSFTTIIGAKKDIYCLVSKANLLAN